MSRIRTHHMIATLAMAGTFSFAGSGGAMAVTPAEPLPAEDLQTDIATAQTATDAYWATHWNEFFEGSYTSPVVVGLYDGTDPATAPVCGGQPLGPGNAYYCPEGDYVAWDAGLASLPPGEARLLRAMAHGWIEPSVSIVLAEDGEVRTILGPSQADGWQAFYPETPETLPRAKFWRYHDYLRALARQQAERGRE